MAPLQETWRVHLTSECLSPWEDSLEVTRPWGKTASLLLLLFGVP